LVKGRDAGAPWKGHKGHDPKDIFSTRYSTPGCRTGGLGVSLVWVISVENFDVPVEVFRACSGIDLETTLGSRLLRVQALLNESKTTTL
jgi:hypothetical protein